MGAYKLAKNTPMPQNISAQIVCPSLELGFHWASVVRDFFQELFSKCKPCTADIVCKNWFLTQVEIKKSC